MIDKKKRLFAFRYEKIAKRQGCAHQRWSAHGTVGCGG